jgi:isoquinoline 1-oxidoreductase beta subunit
VKQFAPNAYLEITPQEGVVFWTKRSEMGQHINTTLAVMAADELGADLNTMKVKSAATHPRFGFVGTGGSYATAGFYQYFMPLMAAAREMLCSAASLEWDVPASELYTEGGFIHHPGSGRRALLEAFAELAADLPVPENPLLKKHSDYKYIGKSRGRIDQDDIVTGKAKYGIDTRLEGMRFAVVEKAPATGAVLSAYDTAAASKVWGVEEVLPLDDRVFIIAQNSWSAIEGRKALKAEWRVQEGVSTRVINNELKKLLDQEGNSILTNGNVPASAIAQTLVLEYAMPAAQHAALEPVNAVAVMEPDTLKIWAPCHMATPAQNEVAALLDIPKEKVEVHNTLIGGSFGRKLERDYVLDAAMLAARVPYPVQLLYTREDDMTQGGIRPSSIHKVTAEIDTANKLQSLTVHVATPSVFFQQDPSQLEGKGYDWTIPPGLTDIPYSFPYFKLSQAELRTKAITYNWWRGTQRNNNAFALECAIDEIAAAIGEHPIDFRLGFITRDKSIELYPGAEDPVPADRARVVLQKLREVSDFDRSRSAGRALGVALHFYGSCHTYVGHVVEVSVSDRTLTIHKVWAVADCGLAISPEGIRSQLESGVIFGLTSALWGKAEVEDGVIQPDNFDSCRLMRMPEVPLIETHIIDSNESPGGMGEPPLPSVTPALLNAIARAGGPRIRSLPVADHMDV